MKNLGEKTLAFHGRTSNPTVAVSRPPVISVAYYKGPIYERFGAFYLLFSK